MSGVAIPEHLEAQILQQLPVGLWVGRAPSGEFIYANEAFSSIVGVPAKGGARLGEAATDYRLFDRAGRPFPMDQLPFVRVLATGRPVTTDEVVIHRHDGQQVHVRAFARPMRNAEGVIDLVAIAFLDITTETTALHQGKTVQQRLTFAVNNAPVILTAFGSDQIVTLAQGAALRTIGLRAEEMVGRPVLDVFGGLFSQDDIQRSFRGEVVNASVDRMGLVIETHLNPVFDENGEIAEVVGICTDVTAKRRLQAQTIQNDRLMAMGTLAASVAHEINNPLTYILGNLDLIDQALWSTPIDLNQILSLVADIRAGAERVAVVARDMRSFARPEDEVIGPVDVNAVVRAVLQLVRKDVEAHAKLVISPGATPPVRANEARLGQVLLNLLVNAWQSLRDPDPQRHKIEIATSQEADQVVIEISDTGPGVSPQARPRIFDPFFTTKEVGRGTGLGLFVCRNIVTAFGGEITTHNRPEGGAVFRVALPAAPELVKTTPAPDERPSTTQASVRPRHRILIIDDDAMVAGMLVHTLQSEFDVSAIHDARQALTFLTSDAPLDLIYCDLMMSGLTGMDIYEHVSQHAPERLKKLVFMTGGAFTKRASTFIDQIGDAVVYKPFPILGETRRRLGLSDGGTRL